MLSGAATESAHTNLRPRTSVDTVCAMGTMPHEQRLPSTTFHTSHTSPITRGLFCAQLLASVFDALAEAAITRHLPAHLIDAMNDGGVIAATECLSDLDQLHLQE